MSYILDALRKADAQRERDASRGIHAQGSSLGPAAAGDEPGARNSWFALAAVVAVVFVAAAWFFTRSEPAPITASAPPAVAVQAPPAATAISPPAPPPAPIVQPPAAVTPGAVAAPILGGLPPDAPRVAISGGVYSPNPAQRMLIVNGQVFNEGSEVAPGVKVEAIQARTATLGFRGARYTVAY